MSRNACENRRNGNDFHSGHRKQNSDLLIYFNTKYKWFIERKYIVFNFHTKNL